MGEDFRESMGRADAEVTAGGVIVIPGTRVTVPLDDGLDSDTPAELATVLEEEPSLIEVEFVSPAEKLDSDTSVPEFDDSGITGTVLEPVSCVVEETCTILIVVRMTVTNVVELRSIVLVNEVVVSEAAVTFEVKSKGTEFTVDELMLVSGPCADIVLPASVLPDGLLLLDMDGTMLDVPLAGKGGNMVNVLSEWTGGVVLDVPSADEDGTMVDVLSEGTDEAIVDVSLAGKGGTTVEVSIPGTGGIAFEVLFAGTDEAILDVPSVGEGGTTVDVPLSATGGTTLEVLLAGKGSLVLDCATGCEKFDALITDIVA
ncbi:hypothetical protein FOPE_06438 [Fonsecaea pedrosoi]|nr:hypothetical protein FOPE_06438 [Fonsecaea pedrosoi]